MKTLNRPLFTGLRAGPMEELPFPYGDKLMPLDMFEVTIPADVLWRTDEESGAVSAGLSFDPAEIREGQRRHQDLEAALVLAEAALSKAVVSAVAQRDHERSCDTCVEHGLPSHCPVWAKLLKSTSKAAAAYETARGSFQNLLHPLAPRVGIGN